MILARSGSGDYSLCVRRCCDLVVATNLLHFTLIDHYCRKLLTFWSARQLCAWRPSMQAAVVRAMGGRLYGERDVWCR